MITLVPHRPLASLRGLLRGASTEDVPALEPVGDVVTPTLVLYEVYRWARRERDEETAMLVAGQMTRSRIVELDQTIALVSADLALEHGLAMADAIVYATARTRGAEVLTSDADFEGLDGVRYLPR